MNPDDITSIKDLQITCNGVPMNGGCSERTCGESENKEPIFIPQTITMHGKIDSVFNHVYHAYHAMDHRCIGHRFLYGETIGSYALCSQKICVYVRNLSRRVALRRRIIAGMR